MSGMRQRRPRGGAGGAEDMTEPLLGEQRDDSAAPVLQPRALIVHRPFDLEAFLAYVFQSWLRLLRSLSAFVRSLLGSGSFSLSVVQAERLEALTARLGVAYDPADAADAAQLRELWALAFPGQAPPPAGLKSPAWKDIGFQGEDPATDFRGAGLLGLECLLHLATHHPRLWAELRHKTNGTRAAFEYPLCAAGIGLAFSLQQLLGLKPGAAAPGTRAGRAFCQLLGESEAAFEEVCAAALGVTDAVWLQLRADYMQYPEVHKRVLERMQAALEARPASIAQLWAALGVRRG